MKRMKTKGTVLILITAMLVSLFAPLTAFAAVQLTINNLFTTAPSVGIDNSNDSQVLRFTTNPITLAVTINGIANDKITDIYYEILNINTGINLINKTNKAAINPQNSNEVTFAGVTLSEGLNKITVKYGDTSVISSSPGWGYFTPVTNITDLVINNENFIDGGMYPKQAPYSNVTISGKANNADQIQANVSGTVYGPSIFNKGAFSYITNTNRTNDLSFKPGDNEIQFIAQNGTNSYEMKRSFVYDNGKGFAYGVNIDLATTATPSKLAVQTPTIVKSSTDPKSAISLKTNLKVSKTAGVTDYVYAEISTTGTNYKLHYDFPSNNMYSIGAANLTDVSPVGPTSFGAAVISNSQYDVYSVLGDLAINSMSKYQEVVFSFTTSTGRTDTTRYSFNFIDKTTPYVDHVERVVGALTSNVTVKLNEVGASQINEIPSKLRIFTTYEADSVKIELNGLPYAYGDQNPAVVSTTGIYPTVQTTVPGPDNDPSRPLKVADIYFQNVSDGFISMKITPIKSGGGATQGQKTYGLNVTGVPYVILNDIYDGRVYKKQADMTCGASVGPCISGRFVNLPVNQYANVKFFVNDKRLDDITPFIDTATGKFTIPRNEGITPAGLFSLGVFNSDGKKTIRFDMYNGSQLITQSSYDVFILSDQVPFINVFRPIETNPTLQQFKKTADDTYVTNSKNVTFTGDVKNSTRLSSPVQYKVSVRGPGMASKVDFAAADYTAVTNSGTLENFTELFSTTNYTMDSYGDYFFELSASNPSGVSITRTVKITREPTPYTITQPILVKNQDGKDQANINQNFQSIIMEADGADSILFGKDLAVKNGSTFTYEATDLKVGKNEIKFTVNRGTAKTSGSIILYHVNTPIEGAQYKDKLGNSSKVFDGDIELKFPKDTKLMRNDRSNTNQYLTIDRTIMFGIANIDDGRVDKALESNGATQFLSGSSTIGHYKPASKRFWIDAGTSPDISSDPNYQTKLKEALQGSGTLPQPASGTAFFSRNINDIFVPTKKGTLTLKYDPNIRDDAWKYLGVFQFNVFEDESGSGGQSAGWRNLGGIVDNKKNTITVPVDSFGFYQVMYMNDSFEDITNHPWARNDLDTLYSKGYMLNKDAGNFLPNDAITRGEFVTMLVKMFDIPLKNEDTLTHNNFEGTFADVRKGFSIPNSNGLYDYLHIEAAARAGIVRGSSQGLFLPGGAITRQDAAVMIARVADLKMGTNDAAVLSSLQKLFTDSNSIDVYARGAVEAISKIGFIEGKENVLLQGQKKTTIRFDPLENFTRAEAAAVSMRILKNLKKLPK